MTRPGMAAAVRLSLTHAVIYVRACSRPAAYSSPIDISASWWWERRACSI